jgi:acyl-coenzyme A synthetase/AMP-(fatty) acid ligase
MSFIDTILFHGRTIPERPAIILADRVVTYGMLTQGILSVEKRLLSTSLRRGDLAAIRIENPIRHFTMVFALFRLGIVSVSVTRPENLADGGLEVAAVLTDRPLAGDWAPRSLLVDDGWYPTGPTALEPPARPAFAGDAICRVRYSTGTTGGRKAIGFTAADLEWAIATRMTMFANVGWGRMLCLSHFLYNGFSYALLALASGNTLLFADTADEALRLIDLYAVDLIVASPQHLRDTLAAQREMPTTLPSLKLISVGGAAMEENLRAAAQTRLCKNILSVYSATESGPIAIGLVERLREFGNATGFVTPWAEVEIVGDDGAALPFGEEGTVRVRAERPARVLGTKGGNGAGDPWFLPGDRGKLLPNGALVVTGRITEFIDVAGTKMPPERIEELLLRRPDLRDAAAIEIPGAGGAMQLWVVVTPKGPSVDPDEIAAYLAAQDPPLIAHRVKIADAVPRGETGKILRRTLRDQLKAGQ